MIPDLQTVNQMTDLTNAIHALIGAIVLGLTGVAGAYLYQIKIYLPRQFKQRDEERANAIEAAKLEMQNKVAAEKVDIARENMLPTLLENMMQANNSTVQMAQSFHQTMMQSVQQNAMWSAQLKAHDGQLTANTERLEELAQTVDTAITNIQVLKEAVEKNTDQSKTAAAYGEVAAKTAQETLELVKRKIIQVVADSKSDTGELKPVNPATADGAAADSTGAAAA